MSAFSGLRSAVRGRVTFPGDEGFEQARTPWNLMAGPPVLAVVEAVDADDVSAVLRYAHSAGITVTVRPSGHGASGNTADAILLRTGLLDQIRVDAGRRTARIGAGARSGQVQAAAAGHGLTGMPGSSSIVSVTGYTLGGGLSWLARKYGWAAGHVTAFEVVDAAGDHARVTAASDPALFWALRGGGGDFAVVTSMECTLHAESLMFSGRMTWPADRAHDVLAAFIAATARATEELTLWANLLRLPGSPPLVAIDVLYLGEEQRARNLMSAFDRIEGLVCDNRAVLPVSRLGPIAPEMTDPAPLRWRGELLTGLDEAAVKALLSDPIDPLVNVQIRHAGGALSQDAGIPPGPVPEPYGVLMFGLAGSPEQETAIRARQGELAAAIGGYVSGRKPYNVLGPGDRAASAFSPDALARLRQIKRDRDPQGTIRSNYPVLD